MVLDLYKQAYTGQAADIRMRIKRHWSGTKQFERLIFGTKESSVLSIDSFRALDTTRIFAAKTPPVEQATRDQPTTTLSVSLELNPCLEVAGTTTFANNAVAALADRKGLGDRATTRARPSCNGNPRILLTRTPSLYVWLGAGEPEWAHTRDNPPALTSKERINDSHSQKALVL